MRRACAVALLVLGAGCYDTIAGEERRAAVGLGCTPYCDPPRQRQSRGVVITVVGDVFGAVVEVETDLSHVADEGVGVRTQASFGDH